MSARIAASSAPAPAPSSRRRIAVGGRHGAGGRGLDVVVSAEIHRHAAWAELEETGLLTPFQRRAWLQPWYRIVAPALGAEPLIVTILDRASGRALAVLPLCRRRQGGVRIVEFAGTGVSDYNAPLLAAGYRPDPDAVADLVAQVRRALPETDLLRFDRIPALVDGEPNPLAGLPGLRRLGFQSWAVALPATREAYDGALDPTVLKEVRRKTRRLAGRGTVAFGHLSPRTEGRAAYEALKRHRARRFADLGRVDLLGDPVHGRFYEAVLFGEDAPVGAVSGLSVDGEFVATMLTLQHRRTSYLLMSAFDGEAWKSCSPGVLGIDRMVSGLIARDYTCLDLTIGDEAYKTGFGALAQPLYLYEAAIGWRGLPARLRAHGKAAVKRLVPPALLARLRRR